MRIHLTVMVFVLIFSAFYDFSPAEYALLILAIGSVIGMEVANTAIETVVDMFAVSYSSAAKLAKDLAAGAVLLSAAAAMGIGIILFWDIPTFVFIYTFFIGHPMAFAGLILLFFAGIMFIFKKNR